MVAAGLQPAWISGIKCCRMQSFDPSNSLKSQAEVMGELSLNYCLSLCALALCSMRGLSMGEKLICQNKKAWHNYFIEDTYQAGISLLGSEVKSLREGKVNLGDSYGDIKRGEVFLVDAHISPYPQANRLNHDPLRTRKLLLHKTGDSTADRKGARERIYPHPASSLLFQREGQGGARIGKRKEALR